MDKSYIYRAALLLAFLILSFDLNAASIPSSGNDRNGDTITSGRWIDTVDVEYLHFVELPDSLVRFLYQESFTTEYRIRRSVDSLGLLIGGEPMKDLSRVLAPPVTATACFPRLTALYRVAEEYGVPESSLDSSALFEEAFDLCFPLPLEYLRRPDIIYLAFLQEGDSRGAIRVLGLIHAKRYMPADEYVYSIFRVQDQEEIGEVLGMIGVKGGEASFTDVGSWGLGDDNLSYCQCNGLHWQIMRGQKGREMGWNEWRTRREW